MIQRVVWYQLDSELGGKLLFITISFHHICYIEFRKVAGNLKPITRNFLVCAEMDSLYVLFTYIVFHILSTTIIFVIIIINENVHSLIIRLLKNIFCV